MKRSEMIDMIVYECLSWDGLETSGVPAQEIASDILKCIEKHGMLPPTIVSLRESYNRTDGRMGFDVNEWEPEEE